MFAARDQENRVFGHSVGGAAGKLHALGPKTPLKVPLRDAGGTTAKRPLAGRENVQPLPGKNLVTPMERTQRAPLGNKTTNAKALTVRPQNANGQQQKGGGVKDIVRELERTAQQQQQQQQQTAKKAPGSTRRRGVTPRTTTTTTAKLPVLSDVQAATATTTTTMMSSGEPEYAAPRDPQRPYESDIFPDGVLTFAAFRPENRLRGYYDHYYNPVDDDGVPRREKELAEQRRRALEKLDLRVQADVDAMDWSLGLGGLSFQQEPAKVETTKVETKVGKEKGMMAPPTIAARRAAAALAPMATVTSKKTAATRPAARPTAWSGLPLRKQQRPATSSSSSSALPLRPKTSSSSNTHHPVAEAASRTTLGYTKGRTVSSAVRTAKTTAAGGARGQASRAPSAAAASLDVAVQTTQTVQTYDDDDNTTAPRSPAFLSIFDVAADDQESDWGGASTVVNEDDLDEEFQMEVNF